MHAEELAASSSCNQPNTGSERRSVRNQIVPCANMRADKGGAASATPFCATDAPGTAGAPLHMTHTPHQRPETAHERFSHILLCPHHRPHTCTHPWEGWGGPQALFCVCPHNLQASSLVVTPLLKTVQGR